MRKSLLIATVALLGLQGAFAADFVVTKNNGDAVKVANVQKIVFGETGINVVGAKESATLPFADFSSISFAQSADQTGVSSVGAVQFSVVGNNVVLPSVGDVKVYNAAGQVCVAAVAVESLDITDLASGVYVVEVVTEAGRGVAKIHK